MHVENVQEDGETGNAGRLGLDGHDFAVSGRNGHRTRRHGTLGVADETRPQAIDRALRALGELVLEGVPTTRELAIDILRSEEFGSGRYSTDYLAEAADRLPAMAGS